MKLGHVRQRSPGRWELRWRDAARKLHTKTVAAKSERDAHAQLVALVAGPVANAPHRMTLGDYLPKWLDGLDLRPTTRQHYASVVKTYLAPDLGHIRLRELSSAPIRSAFLKWAAAGAARSSLRQVKVVLQSVIRSALIDDLITVDPMQKLRAKKGDKEPLPIGPSPKAVPVSDEKIAELLATDTDSPYHIAVVLMVAAGLRRGEALGLRWRHVDLEAGRIRIVEQRVPVIGGARFAAPKSASGKRTINLPREAVDALRAHRRATATALFPLGVRLGLDHTVACNAIGAPLDPNSFSSWARRRGIKLHNLRHAHLSKLANSGIPIAAVSKRAGHSSIATTIATYVHADDADDTAAANVISGLMR
jgi:integrase